MYKCSIANIDDINLLKFSCAEKYFSASARMHDSAKISALFMAFQETSLSVKQANNRHKVIFIEVLDLAVDYLKKIPGNFLYHVQAFVGRDPRSF